MDLNRWTANGVWLSVAGRRGLDRKLKTQAWIAKKAIDYNKSLYRFDRVMDIDNADQNQRAVCRLPQVSSERPL